MTLVLQRTVAGQIATQVRASIERGVWRKWLPSERQLSFQLQASRNSVRAGLRQLKLEGVVMPTRGLGYRVVEGFERAQLRTRPRTIGMLVPQPVASLQPSFAIEINELRDFLAESGYRLLVHLGEEYYSRNPHQALERLLRQNSHDAWVLLRSSHAMQKWFADRGVCCVISGSCYPGIDLPFCDLDHRAISRHAAGVLYRLGHRHIALLSYESIWAGVVDSQAGFLECAEALRHSGVSAEITCHNDEMNSVDRALHRLLGRRDPPTGIVVDGSHAYLAVFSLLAQRGLRIPRDISLICRHDDAFMQFLAPAPARYLLNPQAYARDISGMIHRLITGRSMGRAQTPLFPRFVANCSIGIPRSNFSP